MFLLKTSFNLTYRYIDDVLSLEYLISHIHYIYIIYYWICQWINDWLFAWISLIALYRTYFIK